MAPESPGDETTKSRRRLPGLLRKLLGLSLPALVAAALLLEVLLRIGGYTPYYLDRRTFVVSQNPEIVYELRPGFEGLYAGIPVSINSKGFRGPEEVPDSGAPGLRILIVGDSVAFGQGVREGETLRDQMEQQLAHETKTPVAVVNLGVPGYNTAQEYWTFKERGLPLKPKVVVLLYVSNDPDPPVFHVQDGAVVSPDVRTGWFGELMAAARKHSHAYNLVWTRWQLLKHRSATVAEYAEQIAQKFDEKSPTWQKSRSDLAKLLALAQAHSCRVIVVPIPEMFGIREEPYPFAKYINAVCDMARAAGAECLDVVPLLREQQIPLTVSTHDSHPSAEVYRILARHLAKMLR